MEKEKEKEIDSRAESPLNTPPPHLGCGSRNQNQTQEELRIARLTMNKRTSASEIDGGEFRTTEEELRIKRMRPVANDDGGVHRRVSRLERIVRVLKRTHSSLRREYWTSPPTSDELRLHHLILIHVTSYISLFDIELSRDGPALPTSSSSPTTQQQQQQEGDDDDLEEMFDVLETKALPVAFATFLDEARKAACPRLEDDPLLKDTSTLKSMMDDNSRNREKKEELLRVLSDLEVIGRSRGYAPPLSGGREIECYREIRNWAILSILFVFSSVTLQSDALPPGDSFCCVSDHVVDHFVTHTPLLHLLSAGFEMIPFRRFFLDQCRRHISRILEKEEGVVDADEVDDHAEYNNDVDGDLVMEGAGTVDISNNTSAAAAAEAHQDNRGGGRRTPLMLSRLDCLHAIASKLIHIGSLRCCPNPPTKEEARLYAQIVEHVHSSAFLFL